MNCLYMPRVRKNFLIDERVTKALDSAAKKAGYKNANQFVEATLFNILKLSGNLGPEELPLAETRGSTKGERRGGRKKITNSEESLELPETVVGVDLEKKSENPIDVDPKIINGD